MSISQPLVVTNPTPPTLERLQSLNADQITLDDLQEVFEITRAKATSTLEPKELLTHANDIGRLAILARRVTEYLKGKGIMTGSEPFKYFERLMNTEAQSIRDLSRRLTPPPPVTVTQSPPTKPIIEIKTLVYPSDEEIAAALNAGWQINHCATIVAASGATNKHAWMILLQREKPAESAAPIPATTTVGAPPVASAPDKDPKDDTQLAKRIAATLYNRGLLDMAAKESYYAEMLEELEGSETEEEDAA